MAGNAWKGLLAALALLLIAGWLFHSVRRGDAPAAEASAPPPFRFMLATAGVASGGARGVRSEYAALRSSTVEFGVTVPVLYLRTTKGRERDFTFDADFDVTRRCGERLIADDSLNGIVAHAIANELPTMFVLNGGVWADAACDVPEVDLNDYLEREKRNCQWSQSNEVFADDHLAGLAGAMDSPQLGRSLTFNVYAAEVRRYKRRNLAAAASRIAEFARAHPNLFVGVTLDSDTTMNPFFNGEHWYDYNPGTLRQFREWLRGAGPYAGEPTDGAPDLRDRRRARPLLLAEVNALAGARWTSWDEVDPPRKFPGSPRDALREGDRAYWDDPWFAEWDRFRKHLVALHYDELARWASEAGIAQDRIYSAQGFAAPFGRNRPFALRTDSAGQNYDSAGVSMQGAKPGHGHLGAILYGKAATNDIPTENGKSLFWNFGAMDAGWGVVEFSTAVLNRADHRPGYADAYRAYRDLFNFDAALIAPMAWNGPDGKDAGQPGYKAYMAWRNTPAEAAMKDFARSHAGVPRGSRLWTFGSDAHASDDGWRATGAVVHARPGSLAIEQRESIALLTSPPDQLIRPESHTRLVIGATSLAGVRVVTVRARLDGGIEWVELARRAVTVASKEGIAIDLKWPEAARHGASLADQIRIEWEGTPPLAISIDRIVLVQSK